MFCTPNTNMWRLLPKHFLRRNCEVMFLTSCQQALKILVCQPSSCFVFECETFNIYANFHLNSYFEVYVQESSHHVLMPIGIKDLPAKTSYLFLLVLSLVCYIFTCRSWQVYNNLIILMHFGNLAAGVFQMDLLVLGGCQHQIGWL